MSLMRPGQLQYRCRRCASVNNVVPVPNLLLTLTSLADVANESETDTPQPMISIHNCPDGGLGVADVIGGVFDSPPPESR